MIGTASMQDITDIQEWNCKELKKEKEKEKDLSDNPLMSTSLERKVMKRRKDKEEMKIRYT